MDEPIIAIGYFIEPPVVTIGVLKAGEAFECDFESNEEIRFD